MDNENKNENNINDSRSGSTQKETAANANGQPYNNQQYAQNGYQQYQPPAGYYNQNQKPVKKISAGFKVLIAFLIILSLAAGGLLTAYVIMPLVNGNYDIAALVNDQTAQQEPTEQNDGAQPTEQTKPTLEHAKPEEPQVTSSADIGGEAPNIDQANNPIVQIAKEVGPSVVGVTQSVTQAVQGQEPQAQDVGYGTGIILTENGYIATNNHVVTGSDSLRVTLFDGTDYEAELIGVDATTDLAVIKIDAHGLIPAALGDSETVQVGETVVAIGNPLGSNLAGSVTSGIISAKDRIISTGGYSQKYIQTDAAINPGNSGGPLVNIKGEVIGINTLKTYLAGYDDYGVPIGTEGIGFAIPTSTAIPILQQLMTGGSVQRPGIGISCLVDLTNVYNPEGAPEGVTIVEVVENGPADKANLMVNDIILSIDGVEIKTVEELVSEIQKHEVGEEIEATVWRENKEYTTTITVGDLNSM